MTTKISADSKPGADPGEPLQLTNKEFGLISDLVREKVGINLTDKKKELVRGRLNSLIKSMGLSSFEDYYRTVIDDPTDKALLSLIDRISTNHSFLFREAEHFDFIKRVALPEITQNLAENSSNDLRIWSAGCAAGEEAYTVAMVLHEYFGEELNSWDIGILGTDISTTALEQAAEGIYTQNRIDLVPPHCRRHIRQLSTDRFSVGEHIKKMVMFKRLNLMNRSFPFKGKFHIVFCRNVMIYFDNATKLNLVARICDSLHDGGYLLIGHSETLGRGRGQLRYMKPTVYKKCQT